MSSVHSTTHENKYAANLEMTFCGYIKDRLCQLCPIEQRMTKSSYFTFRERVNFDGVGKQGPRHKSS